MARSDGIRVHIYGDYDNKQIDKAIRDLKTLRENGEGLGSAMAVQGAKMQAFGASMAAVGGKLTKGLTLPIVGIGAAALATSIGFESAFAGVRKTVDATEEQFAMLQQGIRDMSLRLPASAEAIAGVAEAAGQLGIETDNILGFTETMVNLGEATNLSATDAATALARLANITQMPQNQFDRLGSSVVALGNNLATTESEIVELGLRLAGAGKQIGLTQAEILGFAGALSSVGIEAEAGGSAFSKVFLNIQTAVMNGGKDLEGFARIAGVSAQDFARQFREAPAEAITTFVGGLGRIQKSGGNVVAALESVGVTEVRMRDALLRSAGAGTILADSLDISSQAWEENTALTDEAEQRYKTTASQLSILKNQVVEITRTFGDALIPILISVIDAAKPLLEGIQGLANGFKNLNPGIQKVIVIIGGLFAAIGPVLFVLGKLSAGLGFFMVKLAAANASLLTVKKTFTTLGASLATFSVQMKAAMIPATTQIGALGAAAKVAATTVKTAFLSMATAVKGFLISLGPVGIAIAVLGTAYAIFAGKAADAEAKVNAFKEALLDTEDSSKVKVLQLLTDELTKLEVGFLTTRTQASKTLSQIGIGLDDAAIALSGTTTEFESFIARVNEAGDAAGLHGTQVVNLTDGLNSLRNSYLAGNSAAGQAKSANDLAASAARKLGIDVNAATGDLSGMTDEFGDLAGEAADATSEVKKLSDMFTVFDANVAAIRARDAFRAYMREFSEALAKNNRDLLGNSKAAEQNRDAVIQAFDKKKADLLAWAEANGKGQEDVDKKWDAFTRRFAKRLQSEGFKAKDIEQFLGANQLNVASVNVQHQYGTAIGGMAASLGPIAWAEFKPVGAQMGKGIGAGLFASKDQTFKEAIDLIRGARDAAKAEAQIQSPSKVFMEIGRNVVKGFVDGINSGKEDSRKAAKESMVAAVKDSYDKALGELRSRLDTARAFAMEWRGKMIGLLNLGTAFSAAQDKDQAEAEALKNLTEAQTAVAEARKGLAAAESEDAKKAAQDRVDAELSVLAAAQGAYQAAAATAAGSWVDEFKAQLTKASNFAALLQQLKNAGAHEMLVQQIAEAGVDAGTQMATDLINGGPSGTGGLIDQFNTDFVTFDAQVTQLGIQFANSWALAVGPKMGNLTAAKSLAAFRKEFGPGGDGRARLMSIMDNLAASMSRTARVTVVVDEVPGARVNIDGRRAEGGRVWPGGTFLVGEKGPELFQPSAAGTIVPNKQLTSTRMTGSSVAGGTTINLTVNAGLGTSGAEVGRQIVDALKAYERRNGAVYVSA